MLRGRLDMHHYSDPLLRARHEEFLQKTPQLEYLFLFHGDGRLREAALDKINGSLPAAWIVCALAWRLNDWAEPVRRAALHCAERTFPATPPGVIAEAYVALLPRFGNWGRMGEMAAALDAALCLPEVADRLADRLLASREGSATELLRQALRRDGIDNRLRDLARNAILPGVRGVALQTLLEGTAIWPIGRGWEWVNKSIGERKTIKLTARREVGVASDAVSLIDAATRDKSALVRRRASQALVDRRFEDNDEIDRLAAIFVADRNRRVREPSEFVQRERAKRAVSERAGPAA